MSRGHRSAAAGLPATPRRSLDRACNVCWRVRVALVHPHFSRSSSLERDSVLLATGLAALGVEVHCYCDPGTRTADAAGVTFHGVPAVRVSGIRPSSRIGHPLERGTFALSATRALRQDRRLYDLIDVRQTSAWEHDVVTVHGVVAGMQARWAGETGQLFRAARLRAGVAPVVRPQVGLDRMIQARQFRRGRFRRVIAVTDQVRDDLFRFHAVPFDAVDVIPPPIDLERLEAAEPSGIRARLRLAQDEPLLLFVGHAFQRKGLDRLLLALAEIPEASLVVVGDGDRDSVAPLIVGCGLGDRVHFAGRVDEPERYYAEADLLVLPTRSDPWGIPLLEAMAAGIPVVSTSMAGAAGVVASARAGIVLADDSPTALRDAVRGLLGDPACRRKMGERGRAAAKGYGALSHARAVLETYERTLAGADSRRDGLMVS
jgi:glycosyltransferase involved in cell wall biosynthesis